MSFKTCLFVVYGFDHDVCRDFSLVFIWLLSHSSVMLQGQGRRSPRVLGTQAAYHCNWVLQGLLVSQVLHLKLTA